MVSDSRSGDARSAIREVKEDVRQLKQDVSQAASAAAHSGMEAIRSGASQVSDRGRRVAEAAKDTHERMCSYVSEHPTTSLLIAVGVGAVLGQLISLALPRR